MLEKIIPLKDIKYVLLDLDGTLLDKYFDDYFWQHLLPERFAEKNNITFGRAREELFKKYLRHEATLKWTDIDFWSQEVDIDIPALKEQIKHLIEAHPHVEEFLKMLKAHRKKVFLVTNAHYKVLDLKLKKIPIGKYFNDAFTSFDIGFPKERIEFWKRLQEKTGFDTDRTLFIDDTEAVLKTAKKFGIKYILLKRFASSRENSGAAAATGFPVVSDFRELMLLNKKR